MSDQILVSTRKGLFHVVRRGAQWDIDSVDFLGDNVTPTLTDPRDGRSFAALDHGHFGVKLHRSTATGWEEIAAPAYPPTRAMKSSISGADRLPGARRASGRSKRVAPTSRA